MVIRHGALQKRSVNARWLAEEIQGVLKPALEKAGIALQVLVKKNRSCGAGSDEDCASESDG